MRNLATSIDSGARGTHEPSAGASAALDKSKTWSRDRREGPCISNRGEVANEEENGHDPRVAVRIIVGPSNPSNPRGYSSQHVAWSGRNRTQEELHTSTRTSENRRAKPINAEAIEAAAPNAHYYGRDDPIVGMPCGQAMGGYELVVHCLASLQY
jgi:hypothetical protein